MVVTIGLRDGWCHDWRSVRGRRALRLAKPVLQPGVTHGVVAKIKIVNEPKSAGHAHAGSRTRVTSMGGLYDAATLRAPCLTEDACVTMLEQWMLLKLFCQNVQQKFVSRRQPEPKHTQTIYIRLH